MAGHSPVDAAAPAQPARLPVIHRRSALVEAHSLGGVVTQGRLVDPVERLDLHVPGLLADPFEQSAGVDELGAAPEGGAVRPRHGSVLAFLGPEGARATDISARSGQHKQIVGTIVDELVGLGYVTREPEPDDRRAKRVVLTELGLDEITKARATLAAIEHRHAKDLGVRSFAAFKTKLQEITRNQLNWRQAGPDEPAA
ncbi:MarR family winged helix-turn-helix transcriptional regulator [Micromonospora sp. NPDC005367]|uniref:MarR family winged helix-turn-helix transcriptional regulator n=1 Tax=Micromonospora sp. NPDC005367 TaxID=3155590 RepID=UPI0033AFE58D